MVPRPDSTYPIIIKPYKLDLSQFSEKLIDRVEFAVENVSEQDLDVSLIAAYDDLFEVTLPESIKAGETAAAQLKLVNQSHLKSFAKCFTMEVTAADSTSSRFTVPVKRTLRKPHAAGSSVSRKAGQSGGK